MMATHVLILEGVTELENCFFYDLAHAIYIILIT